MHPTKCSKAVFEGVYLLDNCDSERRLKRKLVDESDPNGCTIYQYEAFREESTGKTTVPSDIEVFKKSSTKVPVAKYPKEKRKAFIALLMFAFGFTFATTSMVLTHQRVPDRSSYPPLPDVSLDNMDKIKWLNRLADFLSALSIFTTAAICLLHRHGWILCRRIFFIAGLLCFLRGVTIYITVLPLANDHYYCSPKLDKSLSWDRMSLEVVKKVLETLFSLFTDMSKSLCGDYIFSGHTVTLMLCYLAVNEYISKRYVIIHWLAWINFWVGMIGLLVSHGHYTIDVLISYLVTTRLFWIYHTLSNNPELKKKSPKNPLSSVWWFPIFLYFEANVPDELPKEFTISLLCRKIISISWLRRKVLNISSK